MTKTAQATIMIEPPKQIQTDWLQLDQIISDRGSKYSVTAAKATNKDQIKQLLKQLNKNKKYARATHHSWAVRAERAGIIYDSKNDDGETGAGNVILRILQKENVVNTLVIVTRWYGGIKLQGERFRHVQDATKLILEQGPLG